MNTQIEPRSSVTEQINIDDLAKKYGVEIEITIPGKKTAPFYTKGDSLLVHLRANGLEATLSDRHNGTTYNIELHENYPRGESSHYIENLFQWFSAMSVKQTISNRFSTHKIPARDALTVSAIQGFSDKDHKTLMALVNEASIHFDVDQPFPVSHNGYEFMGVLREDMSHKEGYRFDVELKATPLQWMETLQKLGYQFIRLDSGQWRFNKVDNED